jgi:hypothetical protein
MRRAPETAVSDNPNFVLIPDSTTQAGKPLPAAKAGGVLARLRTMAATAVAAAPSAAIAALSALTHAEPPIETKSTARPKLVFAVDATASREPAWDAAREVTDALVQALPGELDVALAIHGGSRVHTFTPFTSHAAMLRDRAAGVTCHAGMTRLLPILSTSLKQSSVRVVVYVGDVFEESLPQGRRLADAMGENQMKLIVLHDTADPAARRDAEIFWDLAKRTGGCVLPFDVNSVGRLRDLLSAVAVYAVGGEKLLQERQHQLPGAVMLLEHLGKRS